MAANTNANQTDQFWIGVGQQQYLTSIRNKAELTPTSQFGFVPIPNQHMPKPPQLPSTHNVLYQHANQFGHSPMSAFAPTGVSFGNGSSRANHPPNHHHQHHHHHHHQQNNNNNTFNSFSSSTSSSSSSSSPHLSRTDSRGHQPQSPQWPLPARFGEQLNLSRKRSRQEEEQQQQHQHDQNNPMDRQKRLRSQPGKRNTTPTPPTNNYAQSLSSLSLFSGHKESGGGMMNMHNMNSGMNNMNNRHQQRTTTPSSFSSASSSSFSSSSSATTAPRVQVSPMHDSSKKRRRDSELVDHQRKPSLFNRPWEAYPSAREKQLRRGSSHSSQNGHAGRRHSKKMKSGTYQRQHQQHQQHQQHHQHHHQHHQHHHQQQNDM